MQTIDDAEDPLALRKRRSLLRTPQEKQPSVFRRARACQTAERGSCILRALNGQHYVDDIDSAVVFNSLEVLIPVDGLCIDAVGAGNLAGLLGVLG